MLALLQFNYPSLVSSKTSPNLYTFNKVELNKTRNIRCSGFRAGVRGHGIFVNSRGVEKKRRRPSYRGYLPAILKALDQVEDLDEALKPWAYKLTDKQIGIILKEQSSWERALQIFEWFKRGCFCKLNVIHYTTVITVLGKAGKWSHVLSLWYEMNDRKLAPNNYTYATLIDVYCQGGFHKEALVWLQRMTKQGLKPNGVTMGTILKLYSESSMKAALKELDRVEDLDDALKPSEATLIDKEMSIILKEQLSWERALETFEWFKRKDDSVLNVIHYTTMLRILGKAGRWRHVLSLWDEMNDRKISPNNYTYATLVDVYCKGGFHKEALVWLQRMTKQGMKPDEVTMGTVLQSYSKSSLKAILKALDQVEDLDEAMKPWEYTLSDKQMCIILKEQLSWERALDIFEWFKRKDCYELNVIHYNIVLRILGKAGKWNHVLRLWDEMIHKKIAPCDSTYGTMIDVYCKGGLHKEALVWLQKMTKQGMKPDEVTYSTLIDMHGKAGRLEKASELFALMLREGIAPSSIAYNALINMYGKAGQVKEASEAFALMLREGIAPTTVTFNTMIHICGNHGQLSEVASLVQKMEELQCPPDTRTYNILIDVYCNGGFHKEALLWLQRMTRQGMKPDEITMGSVHKLYKKAGEFRKTGEFFKKWSASFLHSHVSLSPHTYNALIDMHGKAGRVKEASEVFELMLREGIAPTTVTFNTLIHICGNHGQLSEVASLVQKMEEVGCPPNTRTYNILISLHAKNNKIDLATNYFKKMKEALLEPNLVTYRTLLHAYSVRHLVKEAEDMISEMNEKGFKIDENLFDNLKGREMQLRQFKRTEDAADISMHV